MQERELDTIVHGRAAVDGAGVRLTRVLAHNEVKAFDPFLMLDSFDSTDPEDYVKGFPMHPHRGIETITYLIEGEIEHRDSLGNKGVIVSGSSQWMTAGSGILHQEMPQRSSRMLGFQLWLNMRSTEKMDEPKYFDITPDKIPVVRQEGSTVRIVSGAYKDAKGVAPHHLQAAIYDVELSPNSMATLPARAGEAAFLFVMEGALYVNGAAIEEKRAALFKDGDCVTVTARGTGARFALFCAPKLREPVAWGGPIVMNTQQELREVFLELENGTFIKHKAVR
ncbi:MAG TPA: pirin family protein [Feifaniaceae bacterium]|nr:pirin family protein [Feifaniaceae bacterium]